MISFDLTFPKGFKIDYGNDDIHSVTVSYKTKDEGCFDLVNSFDFCSNDRYSASYDSEDASRLRRNGQQLNSCENKNANETSLIIQLVKSD